MNYLLIITGDTNDADYISEETEFTAEEMEEKLPLLQKVGLAIANSKISHNWGSSDYARDNESPEEQYVATGLITEEELETFQQYTPYGEHGIHTIISITLHKVLSSTELMKP